jgi:uncharacterized membrane protein
MGLAQCLSDAALGAPGHVVSGVAMVCYLVDVEFHVIGALCLWCTAVHVTTFLLFVVELTADALGSTHLPAEREAASCAPP